MLTDEEEEVEERRNNQEIATGSIFSSNENANSKLSQDAPPPKNFDLAKQRSRESNVPYDASSPYSPLISSPSSEQALPERASIANQHSFQEKLKKKNELIR